MFANRFRCPDCGSTQAYRSRRRTFLERYFLPFLLLRPLRCANCFRRMNGSLFIAARKREECSYVGRRAA